MGVRIVSRANGLFSNNRVRNILPSHLPYLHRLSKILLAVPRNTRRPPRYVIVNQPNGNKGLGRIN
jgi:hypothetical protein